MYALDVCMIMCENTCACQVHTDQIWFNVHFGVYKNCKASTIFIPIDAGLI